MDWGSATYYFTTKVLAKRLYLKPEWIDRARKRKGIIKEEVSKRWKDTQVDIRRRGG